MAQPVPTSAIVATPATGALNVTITRADGGRFAQVWSNGSTVSGQYFLNDGSADGSIFSIATGGTAISFIGAAMLAEGNFLAAYQDLITKPGQPGGNQYSAVIVNDVGQPQVAPFQINPDSAIGPSSIAVDRDTGQIAIAYEHLQDSPSDTNRAFLQFSNTDGSVGTPFAVVEPDLLFGTASDGATVTVHTPSVDRMSNGDFAVAFLAHQTGPTDQADEIWVRVYHPDTTAGSSILAYSGVVNQSGGAPHVAALTGGGFVVVHQYAHDTGLADAGTDTGIEIFNADGSRRGTGLVVTNAQSPQIAALTTGQFVVMWTDAVANPGTSAAVREQVYNADGSAYGTTLTVSDAAKGGSTVDGTASVTALSNGWFVDTFRQTSDSTLVRRIYSLLDGPGGLSLTEASDTGLSHVDGITSVTAPTVTGSAEIGTTVTLLDNETSIGSAATDGAGHWSIKTSVLAAGNHTISARAATATGATSAIASGLSVVIDTAAPATPSAPDLSNGSDSGVSTSDNITSSVLPLFNGQAEAKATVQLFDGATQIGSGTADTGGNWSIRPTTKMTGGVHVLRARAIDAAGNSSGFSTALTVTIDPTAPAAPSVPDLLAVWDSGTLTTDNITRFPTPAFGGSAEANARITLLDGATIVGTGVANASGAWTIRTGTLTEGKHAISATATDAAGNISAPSSSLSVTIDTTAPAAPGTPDLFSASDSGASNTDNVTLVTTPFLTGLAEAGAAVQIFDGATQVASGQADLDGKWTVKVGTALAAGAHVFRARAVDAAGNGSGFSTGLLVTIDTTAPTTPDAPDMQAAWDTGASATDNITRFVSPNFVGTAEAGAKITLLDGVTVVGTAFANALGAWAIRPTSLTAGKHEIAVTAMDLAGNKSATSSALTVTIDTTAPGAPSTPDLIPASDAGASATDDRTNVKTPTFHGKAEPSGIVTLFDGSTAIGTGVASDAGEWTITASTLADGAHAIRARVTDQAGNVGSISSTLIVRIDTTVATPAAPDLAAESDTGVSNIDNLTKVTSPIFKGLAEADSTIALFDGATQVGSGVASATGAWSITSKILPEGAHQIAVRVTDVAGNQSILSPTLSVTIDTTAPDAPSAPQLETASDTGLSSSDRVTNIKTPILIGTAAIGTTVTLTEGATTLGTAKTDASGNWSITSTTLSDGTHFLTARAVDAAGNQGAASKFGVVAIDTNKPAPPVVTSVGANAVGGSAEALSSVTLFEGATKIGSALANASGAWVAPMFLPFGVHTIHAVTTDRAGNASDPSADQPIQQGTLSNDNLFGSAAADLMGGGLGDDTYHVDNVDDRVTEAPGQGFDIILANVGYTLQPDTSIDFLRAEAGIAGITLTGNASHNAIAGGDGDDVIIGAGGADSLFGQGGIDTFVLQAVDDSTVDPTGRDMIFDFSELQGDILDFSPILGAAGRGASFIGDKAFSGPRQVQAVFDGTATIVSCDIDGDAFADFAIALNGAHSLRKDNFIL